MLFTNFSSLILYSLNLDSNGSGSALLCIRIRNTVIYKCIHCSNAWYIWHSPLYIYICTLYTCSCLHNTQHLTQGPPPPSLCSVTGTTAGCWTVYFYSGYVAQLACNVVTTPGSLACTANAIYCYAQNCGFLNLDAFPLNLVKNILPKNRRKRDSLTT